MDDLEFRRRVYADPLLRDPDLAREARARPARARVVEEAARLERRIGEALEVEVPAGLADRILLRRGIDAGRRRRRMWQGGLSLAAGVVLASWLVLVLWPQPQSLEASVLAHVHREIEKLEASRTVSLDDLRRVTSRTGADLVGELGEVRFADLCPMRKGTGAHLVLAGQRGPVTVFLMPGEAVRERIALADERFVGRIVPTSNGSMAIVAESGEPLGSVERRLRSALRFRS